MAYAFISDFCLTVMRCLGFSCFVFVVFQIKEVGTHLFKKGVPTIRVKPETAFFSFLFFFYTAPVMSRIGSKR